MARSSKKRQIRDYLLRNILEYPEGIAGRAATRFHVTRQYVNQVLRDLCREGLVEASGATRARSYSLVTLTRRMSSAIDPNLDEDRVWRERVQPLLTNLGSRALDICHIGFTEMFNNVRDHSGGTRAKIQVDQNPARVTLTVADDGIGIFRKIKEAFHLDDQEHAVLELTKGKLTTDPAAHSGEGIFFTSRMFDRFVILSGRHTLVHASEQGDWLFEDRRPWKGTAVSMQIDPHTRRSPRSVYDRFTTGEEGDYGFSVTHVPVGLARYGEENLVSRSQAKRVLARLDLFQRIVLDFSGVPTIGQAFADEIFRVYAGQHPEIEFVVTKAAPPVARMIRRALSGDGEEVGVTLVE